jgi:hypothetical protein
MLRLRLSKSKTGRKLASKSAAHPTYKNDLDTEELQAALEKEISRLRYLSQVHKFQQPRSSILNII